MSYSSYSPRSPSSSQPRSRGTGGSSYGYNTRSPFTSTSYGSGTSASSYIKKDLGTLVQAFQRPSGTVSPVRITSVKPISSYSWIEAGSKPTILVPGSPPVWTNANPRRVPQDQGLTYIDQNSARMGPKVSPLTPIFASIEELGADVDLQSFDIVTDRNNLRKLLRWTSGAIDEKDFRIDVELAGKTCLFTRREEKDSENVTEFRGFGHEYEKAATRWPKGSERATGHHRVISINLGGIKVLLRFEIDACTQTVPSAPSAEVDDLVAALAGLSTGASSSEKTRSFKTLDIRPSGNRTLVPQSTLIELKTRAAHKALDMDETAPQLYLSQTPYLYLAKHVKGNFQTVEQIQPDANRVEGQLGKLRETLLDILETVREQGSGVGLCLVCVGRKLELYERKPGTGRAVGPEILSKFGNQQEDDDE